MFYLIILIVVIMIILFSISWHFSNKILIKHVYSNSKKTFEYQELRNDNKTKTLHIKSNYQYDIVGDLFYHEANNKLMIVPHGFNSTRYDMIPHIKLMLKLGYDVFAFDQRSCGQTGGKYLSAGVFESDDLEVVTKAVLKEYEVKPQLGMISVSMGSATILQYAGNKENKADFYIVDCPYTDFYEEIAYQLKLSMPKAPKLMESVIMGLGLVIVYFRAGFNLKKAVPLINIDKIKQPILFINTKEDTYIPTTMTRDLYLKKVGSKEIFEFDKGKHAQGITTYPKEYHELVKKFIEDKVEA